MRYREGEQIEALASHANDDMIVGSTFYGLILGIGFVYAGIRFKQIWLAFWGTGLCLASLASMFVMLG
jgi:hypothetical protein